MNNIVNQEHQIFTLARNLDIDDKIKTICLKPDDNLDKQTTQLLKALIVNLDLHLPSNWKEQMTSQLESKDSKIFSHHFQYVITNYSKHLGLTSDVSMPPNWKEQMSLQLGIQDNDILLLLYQYILKNYLELTKLELVKLPAKLSFNVNSDNIKLLLGEEANKYHFDDNNNVIDGVFNINDKLFKNDTIFKYYLFLQSQGRSLANTFTHYSLKKDYHVRLQMIDIRTLVLFQKLTKYAIMNNITTKEGKPFSVILDIILINLRYFLSSSRNMIRKRYACCLEDSEIEQFYQLLLEVTQSSLVLHRLRNSWRTNPQHAMSWQDKKHISNQYLEIMKHNAFINTNNITTVELDSDTDNHNNILSLQKFKKYEQVWQETASKLPKLSQPTTLRFRKLGNHKVAGNTVIGLYYPDCNCIVIDWRNPSGFIHEYGHALDYQLAVRTNSALSLSDEFYPLIKKVQQIIMCNRHTQSISFKQLKYLLDPSEIFARAYEIYMINKLGNTILGDSQVINNNYSFGYTTIIPSLRLDFAKKFNKLCS